MPCQPREPGWYNDPDALQEEYEAHGTFLAISIAHGGAQSTYSKAWQKHGFEKKPPGPKPASGAGEQDVILDVQTLGDIAVALRERGLNPDEWIVIRVVVNTWDSVSEGAPLPLKQLKVTLRPRLDALLRPAEVTPATSDIKRPKAVRNRHKPRLVVFVGDEQAPYHDRELHALFCQWLAHNTPDEAVHLGDLMDLPTLSRHRPNPDWNAGPQECVQAGYDLLNAYRVSSPDTRWTALPGNHDERLRDYQLQRAPELFGIRAADLTEAETNSLHSLPSLLHFDRLGFSWAGNHADYEHAQVDVSDQLVARHGWVSGANSAEKTVRRLGLNVVVGHTHRQRVHYVTEERMRDRLTMVCVEAGAMCQVEGGLGYTINPDWQQGAYAAQVWPDGSFNGEHLVYRNGVLTWRDQRYAGSARRAA